MRCAFLFVREARALGFAAGKTKVKAAAKPPPDASREAASGAQCGTAGQRCGDVSRGERKVRERESRRVSRINPKTALQNRRAVRSVMKISAVS